MPHFFHISAAPAPTDPAPGDHWLGYTGPLNSDTVQIVMPTDPPVFRDQVSGVTGEVDGNKPFNYFFDSQNGIALQKVGNYLVAFGASFVPLHFLNIVPDTPPNVNEIHQCVVFKVGSSGNSYVAFVAIQSSNLIRSIALRLIRFTYSSGTGFTITESFQITTSSVTNATTDVGIRKMEVFINDPGPPGVATVYGSGFSAGFDVLINNVVTGVPTFNNNARTNSTIPGDENAIGLSNFAGVEVIQGPGGINSSDYVMCIDDLTTLAGTGSKKMLGAHLNLKTANAALPSTYKFWYQPVSTGFVDLTNYLYDTPVSSASARAGRLTTTKTIKVAGNRYVIVNGKGAVLVSMNTATGGGTVLSSIAWPAAAQTGNMSLVHAVQSIGTPIEIIASFNALNNILIGGVNTKIINMVVRVDLDTDTLTGQAGPINPLLNVTPPPSGFAGIMGAISETEIWAMLGSVSGSLTPGAHLLLDGYKMNR